jgi:hypothetical protein
MRLPTPEGIFHISNKTTEIKPASVDEQHEVDQVFHPGIGSFSTRQGVGMDLLGEMLLAGDRRELTGYHPSKAEPFAWLDPFVGFSLDVSHADIEVEPGELSAVEVSLNRKPRPAIRRAIQVHTWFPDHEDKMIPDLASGRRLNRRLAQGPPAKSKLAALFSLGSGFWTPVSALPLPRPTEGSFHHHNTSLG